MQPSKPVPYGYCPICFAKGVMMERSMNGNTQCENGHKYKHNTRLNTYKEMQEAKDKKEAIGR